MEISFIIFFHFILFFYMLVPPREIISHPPYVDRHPAQMHPTAMTTRCDLEQRTIRTHLSTLSLGQAIHTNKNLCTLCTGRNRDHFADASRTLPSPDLKIHRTNRFRARRTSHGLRRPHRNFLSIRRLSYSITMTHGSTQPIFQNITRQMNHSRSMQTKR